MPKRGKMREANLPCKKVLLAWTHENPGDIPGFFQPVKKSLAEFPARRREKIINHF
jgi:hypothetical protein